MHVQLRQLGDAALFLSFWFLGVPDALACSALGVTCYSFLCICHLAYLEAMLSILWELLVTFTWCVHGVFWRACLDFSQSSLVRLLCSLLLGATLFGRGNQRFSEVLLTPIFLLFGCLLSLILTFLIIGVVEEIKH